MQEILDFVLEHPIEVAIPIVVSFLVKALKKAFGDFFKKNHVGVRLLPFIPILLGIPLGLFLTEYKVPQNLLIGAALGGISHYLYKLFTVSLAKKTSLIDKIDRKQADITKVRETLND